MGPFQCAGEVQSPGRPNLLSIPLIPDFIVSSTLRPASFTAAATRSCSISRSSALTTSGSIFTPKIRLAPSILTTTLPPPAEPSTTVACIFFCMASYCCRATCIMPCRSNPPISPLNATSCSDNQSLCEFRLQTLPASSARWDLPLLGWCWCQASAPASHHPAPQPAPQPGPPPVPQSRGPTAP